MVFLRKMKKDGYLRVVRFNIPRMVRLEDMFMWGLKDFEKK